MNKKIIFPLTAIIVILAAAEVVWVLSKKQDQQKVLVEPLMLEVNQPKQTSFQDTIEQQQPVQEAPTEEINTSDWKTYRNEELGFEIKYPEELKVFNDYPSKRTIYIGSPENAAHRSAGIFIYYGDDVSITPDEILQDIQKDNEGGVASEIIEDKEIFINGILTRKIVRTSPMGYNVANYFFQEKGRLINIRSNDLIDKDFHENVIMNFRFI